jgi:type IV secretion system protein VirB5
LKSIRSLIARFVLCAGLTVGGTSAHAGIPVIDVAALVQAVLEVMNSLTEIGNQVTQIEQLTAQVRQMEQQYQSISGARNLGDIMNNPALQNYIPSDATRVISGIQSGGYSGLSGSARGLRDAQMTYNCMDLSGTSRTQCQSQLALPYQQKAFMQDGMDAARGRIAQIQSLMRQVSSSPDEKSVLELQSRITAENALLQHEQTQINLARGAAEAEYRIAESRAREAQMQQATRTGRLADFIPR